VTGLRLAAASLVLIVAAALLYAIKSVLTLALVIAAVAGFAFGVGSACAVGAYRRWERREMMGDSLSDFGGDL
jgi:hypothetical protein